LEVLTKALREVHLIKMVRKAYTTIEVGKLKALLGIQDDQQFQDFITRRGMTVDGTYITVG
jgi:hypothetical protein